MKQAQQLGFILILLRLAKASCAQQRGGVCCSAASPAVAPMMQQIWKQKPSA